MDGAKGKGGLGSASFSETDGWAGDAGGRRHSGTFEADYFLIDDLSSIHWSFSPRAPQSPLPDGVKRSHLWPPPPPSSIRLWVCLMCRPPSLNLIRFHFLLYLLSISSQTPTALVLLTAVLFLIPCCPPSTHLPPLSSPHPFHFHHNQQFLSRNSWLSLSL